MTETIDHLNERKPSIWREHPMTSPRNRHILNLEHPIPRVRLDLSFQRW